MGTKNSQLERLQNKVREYAMPRLSQVLHELSQDMTYCGWQIDWGYDSFSTLRIPWLYSRSIGGNFRDFTEEERSSLQELYQDAGGWYEYIGERPNAEFRFIPAVEWEPLYEAWEKEAILKQKRWEESRRAQKQESDES